jgi:acetylornithine deacetylase/succinyl-diaminopimelate desuccinylase-like protein
VRAPEKTNEALERAFRLIDQRSLLEETYRFVSVPSPTGDEAAFARTYAAVLEEMGLEVELDEEWPASPSVIGRWRGTDGGPVLQLDGHLDAIVVPHAPPVLDLDAHVVRGRGSADMKGGLAAIAHAVRALRQAQVPLAGGLLVTAHGLHEAPGGDQRTIRSLLRKGVRGDAALVAELSHVNLPVAAKGMSIFRIQAMREGGVMHEVELDRRERNPLYGLTLLFERLDELAQLLAARVHPLVGADSLFVGEAHGGDFYNRVPLRAEVVGTRRYALPGSREQVGAELEALCGEVAERTGLRLLVELQEVGPPYALEAGEPVIAAVRRGFRRATGGDLPLAGAGAVGNATDFVAAGVPAVYHGVNQATAHSDDEHVTGSDLLRAARVYAATVVEFCGLAPGGRPNSGVAYSSAKGQRQRGA